MIRLFLLVILGLSMFLWGCEPEEPPPPTGGPRFPAPIPQGAVIYVQNHARPLVTDQQVAAWTADHQEAFNEEFGREWGVRVLLQVAPAPTRGAFQVTYRDEQAEDRDKSLDQYNHLQAYRVLGEGHRAFVNVRLGLQKGSKLPAGASHEMLEMALDPKGDTRNPQVCDGVVGQAYNREDFSGGGNVTCHNFTTRANWTPGAAPPWDFMGLLAAPKHSY